MKKITCILIVGFLICNVFASMVSAYSPYAEHYGPVEEHQKLLQHMYDKSDPYGWYAIKNNEAPLIFKEQNISFVQAAHLNFEDLIDSYKYKTFGVGIYKLPSSEDSKIIMKAYGDLKVASNSKPEAKQVGTYVLHNITIGDIPAHNYKLVFEGTTRYDYVVWTKDEYFFSAEMISSALEQKHIDFFSKITEVALNYGKTSPTSSSTPVIIDSSTVNDKPKVENDIEFIIETNPKTGVPYKGLIADGSSQIKLIVKNNGYEGSVSIESGKFGEIIGKKTAKVSASQKEIVFNYRPLEYLDKDNFRDFIKDFKNSEAVECFAAKDTIKVIFTDDKKETKTLSVDIMVCNPPIFLVHGFTGDLNTWEQLDKYLMGNKYDTIRKEYYVTEDQGGIELQAKKLSSDISSVNGAYELTGFKTGKVDIVGHSMGGLIARYYDKYLSDNAIRKLIMVGTPNHGVPRIKQLAGIILSSVLTEEHILEAYQLSSENPVIIELNEGEEKGQHLKKDVQYSVLYGYGTILGGDGIVSEYSAMLNGIESYGFANHSHSPVLENIGQGLSITSSTDVFDRIGQLLNDSITRTPLNNVSMKVEFATGEVLIDDLEVSKDDFLLTGEVFETKNGEARIVLADGGLVYGHIDVNRNTKFKVEFISSKEIELYVSKGEIRINEYPKSRRGAVVSCLMTVSEKLQKVMTKGTDYNIWLMEEESGVQCMDGEIVVTYIDSLKSINSKAILQGEGIKLNTSLDSIKYKGDVWWDSGNFKSVVPIISTRIPLINKLINNYLEWLKSVLGIDNDRMALLVGVLSGSITISIIILILSSIIKRKRRLKLQRTQSQDT